MLQVPSMWWCLVCSSSWWMPSSGALSHKHPRGAVWLAKGLQGRVRVGLRWRLSPLTLQGVQYYPLLAQSYVEWKPVGVRKWVPDIVVTINVSTYYQYCHRPNIIVTKGVHISIVMDIVSCAVCWELCVLSGDECPPPALPPLTTAAVCSHHHHYGSQSQFISCAVCWELCVLSGDECPPPALPPLTTAAVCSHHHHYGSQCQFSCVAGHHVDRRVTTTCLSGRLWSTLNGTACPGLLLASTAPRPRGVGRGNGSQWVFLFKYTSFQVPINFWYYPRVEALNHRKLATDTVECD